MQKPNTETSRSKIHEKKTDSKVDRMVNGRRQFSPKPQTKPQLTQAEMDMEAEDKRATIWEMIEIGPRSVALRVAGLNPERARDPLTSFTQAERTRIATSLHVFITRLDMIVSCTSNLSQFN